jgi:hypothetical protein
MAWTVFTVRPFICSAFVAFVGRCRLSAFDGPITVSGHSFAYNPKVIYVTNLGQVGDKGKHPEPRA